MSSHPIVNRILNPAVNGEFYEQIFSSSRIIISISLHSGPRGLSVSKVLGNDKQFRLFGIPNDIPRSYEVVFNAKVIQYSEDTISDIMLGPFLLSLNIISVSFDTEILMDNGSTKIISSLKEGEWVAGDIHISKKYQIRNVISNSYLPNIKLDISIVYPHHVSDNIPFKKLLITPLHVNLLVDKKKSVESRSSTILFVNKNVKHIVPIDHNGHYTMWSLQFESPGFYVANGLTIRSQFPSGEIVGR